MPYTASGYNEVTYLANIFMAGSILGAIASLILFLIVHLSYGGVLLLMALESCNIPLPSELIMPFAGFLVSQGQMNLIAVAIFGAIGCTAGSVASYYLGYYGGRPFLEKYGKYILLTKHDLDIGHMLFVKYGDSIAFFSRLLPIVRTFISFPAGVVEMNVKKFVIYSFAGSLIWSFLLAYVGMKVGDNRNAITPYFHQFNLAIEVILLLGAAAYIVVHIRRMRN